MWTMIDDQRGRVADLLDDLAPVDWDRSSLCEGWTVRHVAAHLTLQQLRVRDALAMVLHAPGAALRGDIDTVIKESAVRRAAQLDPAGTVAAIRAMIGSRRHNVGLTPYETLIDICVHGQDIAVPLGRSLLLKPETAAVVARRAWDRGWPWHAAKRYRGTRFRATDVELALGEGREVTGPAEAIALVLTGRDVARTQLSGLPWWQQQ